LSVTITSMSSSSPPKTDATEEKPAKKAGKGKLILIAVPVVLLLVGAGLWFTGILPHMLAGLIQRI
jgi:flagellar protein FliL